MSSSTAAAAGAPWRHLLVASLAANKGLAYSRYLQLATVRADGRPSNRTVVFRGFLDDDSDAITFVTDARSRKVAEVAANPAAEVCWYFPVSREQYRLSGTLAVVGADDTGADAALAAARERAWRALSGAGREQFAWPTPRQPRMPGGDEDAFLAPSADAGPPAPPFCLVVMRVSEVDCVDLLANTRTLFCSAAGASWETQEVNP